MSKQDVLNERKKACRMGLMLTQAVPLSC